MRNKIEKLINSPLFADPKRKAVVSMVFIGHFLQEEINDITKFGGLTIQQYNALHVLKTSLDKHGPMKVADVKKRMTFKESDVSRLLIRLQQKGLIDYYKDPKDKRVQWSKINEAGLTALDEIDKRDDELYRAAKLLTVNDAERLNNLFNKVLHAYSF